MADIEDKITIKDVYIKILALEIEMDTTRKDIHCDIAGLRHYFSKWLWIMVIINIIQTLIFTTLVLQ